MGSSSTGGSFFLACNKTVVDNDLELLWIWKKKNKVSEFEGKLQQGKIKKSFVFKKEI